MDNLFTKQKRILIRMPRCGSSTLVKALRQSGFEFYGGTQMGFWGNRANIVKTNISNNLSECISNFVGENVFKEALKISSVRNPYTRAVSIWKHHSWKSVEDFGDFVKHIEEKNYPSLCAKWHSTTLSEHLFSKNKLIPDYILKLENINREIDQLFDKLAFKRVQLPITNASKNKKDYRLFYNSFLIEKIQKIYKDDFNNFGYSFELPAAKLE